MILKRNLHYVWLLVFGLITSQASAQNCTQILRNTQRAYDEGRIAEIPALITPCLKSKGFTKEERIKAYRLLTLSYVYQYEDKSAENAMLEFIKEVPEYKLAPEDPLPFVNLYKKFRTWPVLLIGITAGVNYAQPQAFGGYTPVQSYSTYTSKIGFVMGFSADIYINKKVSVNPKLLYVFNQYLVNKQGLSSNFAKVEAVFQQTQLALPVVVKYNVYQKNNLTFLAEGGFAVSYVIQNNLDITKTNDNKDINNNNVSPVYKEPADVSVKNLGYSAIIGAGVKYRLGRNYVVADVNYWWGLNNFNKDPWDNANNGANVFNNLYATDDYRMNNLVVSIGYLFPIYNPKLLKK